MGKARPAAARWKGPGAPAGAQGGRAKPNPNPFEVKVNRQKFPVLGRKARHAVGQPGVSRARAVQKVRGGGRAAGTCRDGGAEGCPESAGALGSPQRPVRIVRGPAGGRASRVPSASPPDFLCARCRESAREAGARRTRGARVLLLLRPAGRRCTPLPACPRGDLEPLVQGPPILFFAG